MDARKLFNTIACLSVALLLDACASQQIHTSSSVYDYLYPNEKNVVVQPGVPVLKLPVKVGIAFVPNTARTHQGTSFWNAMTNTHSDSNSTLSEADKEKMLKEVAEHFKKYDYVGDIEIIPSDYLTPGGSFANMQQIGTMYGVDVMALVSYDQMQFTDESAWSMTYWTIVGAYLVSGERNETSTMMDTVVYDIASKRMLFRAPGTSQVKASSTPVNLSEELRTDSIRSYNEANIQMIANLDTQLQAFRDKVKERPDEYQVVKTSGYHGDGSGFGLLTLLVLLTAAAFMKRRVSMRV
jgi:rhombotail lipoprotein